MPQLSLENLPRTTYHLLEAAAAKYANKPAISYVPDPIHKIVTETYTYQEVFDQVNKMIHFLHANQVQPHAVITVLLPNLPQSPMIYTAIESSGAILNPISPALPAEQTHALLTLTQSNILITTAALWGKWLAENNTAQFDKVFIVGQGKHAFNDARLIAFGRFEDYPATPLAEHERGQSTDVCAIFHTSGTTGTPKLPQLTQQNKVFAAGAAVLECGYTEKDVILGALPYFHVGAPTLAGNAAFLAGAQIILVGPFGWMDPNLTAQFWALVAHFKITSFGALAFTYTDLVNNYPANSDCSSLRHALSGTALLPQDYQRFQAITGIPVQEIYGLSELFIASGTELGDASHQATMGKPYPHTQIKVVKVDKDGNYHHEQECAMGEIGLLCVKGPGVTVGYLTHSNDTGLMPDDWLNTGDLGHQEQDGYFRHDGRVFDMIPCMHGEMFTLKDPTHAEKKLISHPAIAQAAIVSNSNDPQAAQPIAFIVLHPQHTITMEEVRTFLHGGANEQHLIPAEIIIKDQLPVNGMGKILKYKLQEEVLN